MKNLKYIAFILLFCFDTNEVTAQNWVEQGGTSISDGFRLRDGGGLNEDWYIYMNGNEQLNISDDGVDLLRFHNNAPQIVEQLSGVFITPLLELKDATTLPDPKTVYKNSGPMAYCQIDVGGGISGDFGIDTATNPSTGVYTIVLDNSWSGSPIVSLTSFNGTFGTEILTYSFTAPNSITVRVVDENNAAIGTGFSIVVFGTPL